MVLPLRVVLFRGRPEYFIGSATEVEIANECDFCTNLPFGTVSGATDLVSVSDGLPTLDDIPGRARDLLMLENGDLRPPYYGHGAVMQVRAIRQHPVVLTALGQISFRLVVARPLSEDEEGHVITAASEALGGAFRVRLEYVDEIMRGPAGKFAEFERQF